MPRGQNCFSPSYALYRLNRFAEATPLLASANATDFSQHLKAQIAYRTGAYAQAQTSYAQLLPNASHKNSLVTLEDVALNLTAAGVSNPDEGAAAKLDALLTPGGGGGGQTAAIIEDLASQSWVVCFNVGCGFLELNDLERAEELLKQARELCEGEEVDDFDEDELEENLAVIDAQLAVVYARSTVSGKKQEAEKIYERIGETGAAGEVGAALGGAGSRRDVALRAVLANNEEVCMAGRKVGK